MDTLILRHVEVNGLWAELNERPAEEDMYLLVDGSRLEGLSLPQFPVDKEFLLADTAFEKTMSDGGILFKITAKSPWAVWLESPDAHNTACVIMSPLEREAVAAHLKQLSSTLIPNSVKPMLFRFYDPRNIEVLLASFTPQEKAKFLGPFSMFAAVRSRDNEDDEWRGECLIADNPAVVTPLFTGPWHLSKESLVALESHVQERIFQQVKERVNRYADTCRELRLLGPERTKDLITTAIHTANESGIFHVNEYTQHAKWMLRFGEYYDLDIQFPWMAFAPKDETLQERWSRVQMMANECYEELYADNYRSHQYFAKRLWLLQYSELSGIRSQEDILVCLSNLWPEKYAVLNEDGLRAMIARARQDSAGWQMEEPYGSALISGVYFICGIDAFSSAKRFPWLVKTRAEMVRQPVGQRGQWLFKRLRRRIESMYRPYKLPPGEERRLAMHFARKRVEERVRALTLADLNKETHALPFYQKMFPEQYQTADPARRDKAARDSHEIASTFVDHYGIRPVLPLVGLFFFTRFLRTPDYSTNLQDYPYVHRIMHDYEIDKVNLDMKAQYAFDFLVENFNKVALPAPTHWPLMDLYRSIVEHRG